MAIKQRRFRQVIFYELGVGGGVVITTEIRPNEVVEITAFDIEPNISRSRRKQVGRRLPAPIQVVDYSNYYIRETVII